MRYEVKIFLNAVSYSVEAENEDSAVEIAKNLAMEESQYDLLKWADYEVEKEK